VVPGVGLHFLILIILIYHYFSQESQILLLHRSVKILGEFSPKSYLDLVVATNTLEKNRFFLDEIAKNISRKYWICQILDELY
jgi:hypothetical protein